MPPSDYGTFPDNGNSARLIAIHKPRKDLEKMDIIPINSITLNFIQAIWGNLHGLSGQDCWWQKAHPRSCMAPNWTKSQCWVIMEPIVRRPSWSHSASSALLPFSGLTPNPQPSRGNLINPSNKDKPSDVSWQAMWMDVLYKMENSKIDKPTRYKGKREYILWGEILVLNNVGER